MSSIMGNDIANINNKLKCKNVHPFGKRFRVMKFINGKQTHIRVFDNFEDARECAETMNMYDLNNPTEKREFITWMRKRFSFGRSCNE